MSKNLKYQLLIISSALLMPVAGCLVLLALYLYSKDGSIINSALLIILTVLIFALKKPLDDARLKSRNDLKYDEFGRLKISNQYEKMSAKEQAEIDRINQLDMERALPSSVVKQLTQKGSEDPEKDMQSLIGLKDVKEKMEEMAARMEFDRESGISSPDTCMHM